MDETGDRAPADEWERREHDVVMSALDDVLSQASFPADKGAIASMAAGAGAASEAPLLRYVQALPERSYRDAGDVKRELDLRWRSAKGLRGQGWEPSARGGPGGGA